MAMINIQRFFSTGIKRLFLGTHQEWLGEVIQNAQRAGAKHFSMRFLNDGECTVSDDGHGLLDGVEGLEKMLVFSDSSYTQVVEDNQFPMGMGLFALITNERIRHLLIESHHVSFGIDTTRWLEDEEYLNSWRARVVETAEEIPGFRMTITGTPQFMEEAKMCALNTPVYRELHEGFFRGKVAKAPATSPFCGYADLLEVAVDGEVLDISLPVGMTIQEPHLSANYQGNEVRISLSHPASQYNLVVNWYGKMILIDAPVAWRAYLEVRVGRPITPRAPTRDGVVVNDALREFYQWIENQIFAWVCTQEHPQVRFVQHLFQINSERAHRESPFVVIQPWLPLSCDYVFSSRNEYVEEHNELSVDAEKSGEILWSSERLGPMQVVRRQEVEHLLLLEDDVYVPLQGGHAAQSYSIRDDVARADEVIPVPFEIGLESLLRATGITAYKAGVGVRSNACLWWKPGDMTDAYFTTELGEWGLGGIAKNERDILEAVPPSTWNTLTEGFVYVASEQSGWDIAQVSWIIGLSSSKDIVPFLESYGCAALWIDDEQWEESEQSYNATVDALIRSYLPHTIARQTTLDDLLSTLRSQVPETYDVHTATLHWVLSERKRLQGLLLKFPDGFEQHINLY